VSLVEHQVCSFGDWMVGRLPIPNQLLGYNYNKLPINALENNLKSSICS
jgi:hypothetical protein